MTTLDAPAGGAARRLAFRFIGVGIVNTLFAFLVYALFVYLGLRYEMANLLSLVAGIAFSFKTHGRFVFGNTSNRLIGRYVLGWIAIYLWTIFVIGRFVGLGIDPYTAGLLALPFSTALSFVVQKFVVFRRP